MILGAFRYTIVNGLELVEDVLDGLHEDWLETPGKGVRIIRVVFPQVHVHF